MTEFSTLIRKRGAFKHKVTSFVKYFDPLYVKFVTGEQLNAKDIIELQIRIPKLEQLFDEFEAIQDQIEVECLLEQVEIQSQERDVFSNNYYGLLAKAKEILKKYEDNDSVASSSSRLSNRNNLPSESYNLHGIKLPPIKCPTFNCEFNKWLEFKDTFEALFQNNVGLSDIQKFHYLRSCLGDEALKIIQSLEFSAQNYNNAWGLLCDRFDNSRLLVNNHLKSLFEIESLSKESSSGLRKLIDSINKHLRALNTLKLPTEHWDAIIIYMVSIKLDKSTNREWEQTRTDKTLPSLTSFFNFLKNRADFLETLEMNNNSKKGEMRFEPKGKQRHYSLLLKESDKKSDSKCNFCKQQHLIYVCEKFLKLSVSERWNHVKQLRLCSNCLCYGHFSSKCGSGSCKYCSGKHSSLLHYNKQRMEVVNEQFSSQPGSSNQQHESENIAGTGSNLQQGTSFNGSSVVCANKMTNSNYVLLSTAVVYVQGNDGRFYKANALLDSGSQCSFISERFCSKLGSYVQSVRMCVSGINNATSSTKSKCEILIKSTINEYQNKITCLVVPKITDSLPSYSIDISGWSIPSNIPLANPCFNIPQVVDLLLGADVFWDILLEGKISLGKNKPLLIHTTFGYVVSGCIPNSILEKEQVICNFAENNDLQKFWLIEELPHDSQLLTKEEDICEEYFNRTVSRDSSGKFVVRIPLKELHRELGESKQIAVKRLLLQETKLKTNEKLREKYVSFMNEYAELEHMRKLTDTNKSINMFRCFLPHFAVIREDSLTTNVRIVFDGSSKTTSGKSLNDIQYIGPAIQNDIFKIMLRFRQHRFVVIADIAKMYRQILVHPDDRYLQNVVWRNNAKDEISTFELQTVTYGTSSAPYLANKCIKHLAFLNKYDFPIACEVIDRDMYVDDLITGFDDEDQGIAVCNQVSSILKSASFSLRKWASNSHVILKGLSDTSDAFGILDLGENDNIKTLGIQWSSQSDLLSFKVSIFYPNGKITKRQLLSHIAKIYDPLGLVSPCIIIAKILIQKLWLEKLSWDDCVPPQFSTQWGLFASRLPVLDNLKIPRFTVCNSPIDIELHGFSDASLNAYSAVIYVRSVDLSGKVYVRLLCSKTKVAPVKSLTIPRLELCGALTLARLIRNVSKSLTLKFNVYYWCDSQIVLSWLNTEATKLQVFVSNRVVEVQRLSDVTKWSYVNTKDNPADMASRGLYPDDLCKNDLWWTGPRFLQKEVDWPREFQCTKNVNLPDLKNKYIVLNSTVISLDIFDKFSCLNKLKRVFAYVLRFIKSLTSKEQKETGPLTVIELENSMIHLSKLAQNDCYFEEILAIKNNKSLSKKSRLLSLNPFIDSDGLLRVGGRLKHSSLSFDMKHPILLDGKHKLSKLIFLTEHIRLLHAGPQLLLFSVRQNFWVTSGMNVSKFVVRSCVRCFRFKPKPANTIMADLPKHRVNISKPFSITGVDYAGPVILRDRKGRPYKTYKAYICLFICFATKSIHIELVTDLTSEAFIATLRRFASRRGTPSHLYSDNASNFVGSQKELGKLYQFLQNSKDELVALCTKENITWHFIPPNSPNFGGLWESNIKAIKNHLYRVIGSAILTFEEYLTLLVQIEAILNSRPLHQMSSDPNDLTPLTPSHLLIGKPLITPPDPLLNDIKVNRLSRFQMLQQINQSFWKRWSSSYLADLQKRVKWKTTGATVPLGTMVVLKNENLPPCRWLLGRVIQVHPGLDGEVRVVTIKTQNGTFKRAISKVCPLPMPSD